MGHKKVDVNSIINFGFGFLKWTTLSFIIVVIGFGAFVWASSIDNKVTTGEAYGFTIGSSKTDIYMNIPKSSFPTSSKKSVVLYFNVELYVQKKKEPIKIKSEFHKDEFDLFEDKNKWKLFYLDTHYFFDNVTLTFCDEKLCEIRRFRLYWELRWPI